MADPAALHRLRDALDQARALLPDPGADEAPPGARPPKDAAAALAACRRLLAARPAPERPPIRTVHHLACTGGTLLSQCIAAMPGTQLLSEVDPLSRARRPSPFAPTDLIGLVQAASRPAGATLSAEIFLAGLRAIRDDALRRGTRLILREHCHDQFCSGPLDPERPTLRELLKDHYPLRSLVTVRHPLDSYLSLRKNRWVAFVPASFAEYCRRYLVFLDRHAGLDILRYEDFVAEPDARMQQICETLDLPYTTDFKSNFGAIRLSGGSGRKSDTIAPRPRRPLPGDIGPELVENAAYAALCDRLGYPADQV